MGQNLKALLQEDREYTADEVAGVLTEVIPGRGIGERFVVSTQQVASNSFVMEFDDGSQYKMTCEKLT